VRFELCDGPVARTLIFRELPYQFASRYSGESKFNSSSVWEYALLLLDKLLGRLVPARFIAFAIVGTFGVGVHFIVLTALFRGLGLSFEAGQTMATIAAITFNFAVNNMVTYSDRRLRGRRWWRGWFLFALACSVGALINVSLASRLYQANHAWYLSALAGLMVGAVWNYWASGVLAWGHGRR